MDDSETDTLECSVIGLFEGAWRCPRDALWGTVLPQEFWTKFFAWTNGTRVRSASGHGVGPRTPVVQFSHLVVQKRSGVTTVCHRETLDVHRFDLSAREAWIPYDDLEPRIPPNRFYVMRRRKHGCLVGPELSIREPVLGFVGSVFVLHEARPRERAKTTTSIAPTVL